MNDFASLWSYLSATPLLWLTATIGAYLIADNLAGRLGNPPWANPVLLSVLLLSPVLVFTNTRYSTYFEGAQFIHFLLGPATVALALPLWDNRSTIQKSVIPILCALVAGSAVAAGSAIALAQFFDLPMSVLLSLAPKSTTAPVALGISDPIDEHPVDHRLASARVCGGRCSPWNWDGAGLQSKPNCRCLCGHCHGSQCPIHKLNCTHPGQVVDLTEHLRTSGRNRKNQSKLLSSLH